MVDQPFTMTMSTSSSSSPSYYSSHEKKHWWLSTKKKVDKYIQQAKTLISTRKENDINSALSQLDSALYLSPKYELALELRAHCLITLRRYKEVADMLQDYIPSYKIDNSDDSSESLSDNSSQTHSRERVRLLSSSSNTEFDSPGCDYANSFKCFCVSDLKKRVLSRFYKNCNKEGQWRYLVLGQACCHLGLMEDALVLLQHWKRLASAASRRESICWSDDSFSFSLTTTTESTHHLLIDSQPLTESESISHLIAHIKVLLRRRAAALAALDAGLFSESIRHFSKILEGRRPAPQAFLAECYLHRSAAYKATGRIAESIGDLNRTLALDPTSTVALHARAGLFEYIGCVPDAVHDLEHVKLIYNSILRDRKPPGPAWKPRVVPYREISGRLCVLDSKIQQLKQRIAMGDTGKVDYFKLIGLQRGCSRSELDRAHLLLVLKHKPEKSMGFLDRCELADEKDYDSVKDRARMSTILLFRLVQKAYSNVLSTILEEEAAEAERKKVTLALQQAQAQLQAQQNVENYKQIVYDNGPKVVLRPKPMPKIDLDYPNKRLSPTCGTKTGSNPFQGVFCRDLAVVGSLLSQVGFNRPLAVKYEALSC